MRYVHLSFTTLAALTLTLFAGQAKAQTLTTLHDFSLSDGAGPVGTLLLSGSTLYGTTSGGGVGANSDGTVFAVNTDGSDFRVLETFNGSNGAAPLGGLTLSGSTLFGTTSEAGPGGFGTIFSVQTNGNGFQTLQTFNSSNGAAPYATMTLSGSTLYGTTEGGTVFSIGTDGNNFRTVESFNGDNGGILTGNLAINGTTLYGTTASDGPLGYGTVFTVQTDGSGFQTLHNFVNNGVDGANAYGGLTLSGSFLYGETRLGGSSTEGTVFRISTDGSNFQLLHSFTGLDGGMPLYTSVFVAGSTLYGTTLMGGPDNLGTGPRQFPYVAD